MNLHPHTMAALILFVLVGCSELRSYRRSKDMRREVGKIVKAAKKA